MFKGITFISSVAMIPVIGQMSPESAVGKLAVGSAQMVLSIIVVAEALAIYKLFKDWRKDVEFEKKESKEEREQLISLIEKNAESNTELAESTKGLKESVYHFAKVIEKCDK